MKKVAKNLPLAEITLRRYERPYKMSKRELIKKLCLSIGLLQPGDSRDVVVDVLLILLESKEGMESETIKREVVKYRKKNNLPLKGVAGSNVRRQLKRLRELFLIERIGNDYRINENEKLSRIFEEKIEKYYLPSIVARVKEYFDAIR